MADGVRLNIEGKYLINTFIGEILFHTSARFLISNIIIVLN